MFCVTRRLMHNEYSCSRSFTAYIVLRSLWNHSETTWSQFRVVVIDLHRDSSSKNDDVDIMIKYPVTDSRLERPAHHSALWYCHLARGHSPVHDDDLVFRTIYWFIVAHRLPPRIALQLGAHRFLDLSFTSPTYRHILAQWCDNLIFPPTDTK